MIQIGNILCLQIDYLALFLSVLAILLPFILYLMKPKLMIEIENGIENQKIGIKVTNKRRCFDAINLNMEVCTVNSRNQTFHLSVDKQDFIILPSKDFRVFKVECPQEIQEKLKETGAILRVRVHAAHSYSGFGKAKQQNFRYDGQDNKFTRIKLSK